MAIGVQHVDESDAQGQPDHWTSTIALTDTLEGEDVKATTIEVDAVTICCEEEELHQMEGLEHGRQAFWGCTQALAGNGGRGWAMLS